MRTLGLPLAYGGVDHDAEKLLYGWRGNPFHVSHGVVKALFYLNGCWEKVVDIPALSMLLIHSHNDSRFSS
jgi:hypothetical protein